MTEKDLDSLADQIKFQSPDQEYAGEVRKWLQDTCLELLAEVRRLLPISRLNERFLEVIAFKERETQKLCQEGDESEKRFLLATQLADCFLGTLDYLGHFRSAVSAAGNKNSRFTKMEEIRDTLVQHFEKRFLDLTGRKYVPEIVRRVDEREKEQGPHTATEPPA